MGESGWGPLVGTIVAAIFGSGGLAAFLNWLHQRRTGVRQEDRADDDALSRRAQDLLETQFKLLVQPLQGEVERLTAKVEGVEQKLEMQRTRYWRLIAYTRALRDWVAKHVTDQNPPPPTPDAELADDL